MRRPSELQDIIVTNSPKCPQEDWARQQKCASAINGRFAQGLDTVLLADEVGMGKTYVALANMASYLFQNDGMDRKVLLITPPSSVLRVKWQQEILSFNEHYLNKATRASYGMRPIVINNYWDLLRNLKDFQNKTVLRVSEETRQCFTWCMFNWAFSRGRLAGMKRRTPWTDIADLHVHDPRVVNFLAHYSEHAIWRFLDAEYRQKAPFYNDLFRCLKESYHDGRSRLGTSDVAMLFKRFAREQDKHEPNVYIIGMNALNRPKVSEGNNKYLSKYLLARLLSRRRTDEWKIHAKMLVDANVLPTEYADKHSHRWNCYVESMGIVVRGDFYGLRDTIDLAVNDPETRAEWRPLSEAIMRGEAARVHAFFNKLGNLVFSIQLKKANFGLAVIDEVHNWKSGAYGAEAFRDFYAPGIENKLVMSATPFQMEEGEMARLFSYVQARGGKSETTMKSLYSNEGEICRCLEASDQFRKAWLTLSLVPAEVARLQEVFNVACMDTIESTAKLIAEDYTESEEMRGFAAALGRYRQTITALEKRLGQVVIRHTKSRAKRNFHIGKDFDTFQTRSAPRNALYPATGYASEDDALVNFIGMRLGQLVQFEEKKSFEANARLLGGMTSSTAAFRASAGKIGKTPKTLAYSDMFESILDAHMHPKVAATVERAFSNFEQGRKTLIFCERVATLNEIEAELTKKIDNFISSQSVSSGITRGNLLKQTNHVDNIWWHSLWGALDRKATGNDLLISYLPDAKDFALRCLAKATVYPSARRIINLLDVWLISRASIDGHLAQCVWTTTLDYFTYEAEMLERECAQDSCPNLHNFLAPRRSQSSHEYIDDTEEDNAENVVKLREIKEFKAAIDVVARQQYLEHSNLWLMVERPEFHSLLWDLLQTEATRLLEQTESSVPKSFDPELATVFFKVFNDLMTGISKFTLRDDLLVRYENSNHANDTLKRIAEGMRSMHIGHDSSMLARVERFLKTLVEADGLISDSDLTQSKRKSLWQGVSIGRVGSVSTLDGSTPRDSRAGLCAAFNSPLLPDILICTSIGSEGIDLHRQCADVIHHDLPWNPAKLEQRNGRVDRVGSLAAMSKELMINIGIPFLAHNYEQHQYNKVYSRAQKFEVLLGRPEFNLTNAEEEAFQNDNEETILEAQIDGGCDDALLTPLPQVVVEFLRLDLSVPMEEVNI